MLIKKILRQEKRYGTKRLHEVAQQTHGHALHSQYHYEASASVTPGWSTENLAVEENKKLFEQNNFNNILLNLFVKYFLQSVKI